MDAALVGVDAALVGWMQPWVEEVAALVEEEAGALVEEVAALVEEEAGALVEEEAARSSSKKCFLHYTQNFMTPCVIMQKILVGKNLIFCYF